MAYIYQLDKLCNDVLNHVFMNLDIINLLRVSKVCKKFRLLILNSDTKWRRHTENELYMFCIRQNLPTLECIPSFVDSIKFDIEALLEIRVILPKNLVIIEYMLIHLFKRLCRKINKNGNWKNILNNHFDIIKHMNKLGFGAFIYIDKIFEQIFLTMSSYDVSRLFRIMEIKSEYCDSFAMGNNLLIKFSKIGIIIRPRFHMVTISYINGCNYSTQYIGTYDSYLICREVIRNIISSDDLFLLDEVIKIIIQVVNE